MHGRRSARNHLLCLAQTNRNGKRRVDAVLEHGVGLWGGTASGRTDSHSACGSSFGIAAALLGDPQILMLDEPVNSTGPRGRL